MLAGLIALLAIRHSAAPEPRHQGRSADAWVRGLAAEDATARRQARDALAQLGTNALPAFARALRQREFPMASQWRRCQRRLAWLGPDWPEAVRVRQCAASALADLPTLSPSATAGMVPALGDRDALVRQEAARALRKQGRAALGPLVAALHDARLRLPILELLADLGPEASEILPAVIPLLTDRNPDTRAAAVVATAAIDLNTLAERLARALDDPASPVRAAAAKALAGANASHAPTRAGLVKLLDDPAPLVRFEAARALLARHEPLRRLLPTFIALLPEPGVGWQATLALGAAGPEAAPAVPALIEALRRERVPRPLRTPPTATLALGRMGAAAREPLVELLSAPEPAVRTGSLLALGMLGAEARPVASRLVPLLTDSDLEVRQAAALSLGQIDPNAAGVAAALDGLTRQEDIYVSAAAAHLLRQRQPAVPDPARP
jgi:HEAT repeat protein